MSRVEILIPAEAIASRVAELGAEITRDYAGCDKLVLLGVLKGSLLFLADLARCVEMPTRIEFVWSRSYAGTLGGEPEVYAPPALDLAGADVIVVEDIIERGTTLKRVLAMVADSGACSVSICALLRKPGAGFLDLPVRYAGFDIGHEFVVGYGLDLDEEYRGLPFVGVPGRK